MPLMLPAPPVVLSDALVERAMHAIHRHTGADFAVYRRPMVMRRLRNHMLALGTTDPDAYVTALHESAALAFAALDRLTIKVTRFYRNAATFDQLAHHLLPALRRAHGEPLRCWSAGCGTGEEAYSLAMVLEHAGIAGTVLATDLDAAALRSAEAGRYELRALAELPTALRVMGRTTDDGHFVVSRAIQQRVTFVRHDLLSAIVPARDAFHLVCCRNVLIYVAGEAQRRCHHLLLEALCPGGVLVLGEAEWPSRDIAPALSTVHASRRLFQKHATAEIRS